MRYVIQHEPTKMDIQAETQQELIEKLKYLNPMFLRIAQQCLEKRRFWRKTFFKTLEPHCCTSYIG